MDKSSLSSLCAREHAMTYRTADSVRDDMTKESHDDYSGVVVPDSQSFVIL